MRSREFQRATGSLAELFSSKGRSLSNLPPSLSLSSSRPSGPLSVLTTSVFLPRPFLPMPPLYPSDLPRDRFMPKCNLPVPSNFLTSDNLQPKATTPVPNKRMFQAVAGRTVSFPDLSTVTSPSPLPLKSASHRASVSSDIEFPPQTMTTIAGADLGGAVPGERRGVEGRAACRMEGS